MMYPRALQWELFKYSKRKPNSSGQTISGNYDPRLGTAGLKAFPVDLPHPQDQYLTNPSQQYRPNLNAPAVQGSEYETESFGQYPLPHLHKPLHQPRPEFPSVDPDSRGVEMDGLISDERVKELSPLQVQRDLYEQSLRDQVVQYNPRLGPDAAQPAASEPTTFTSDLESPINIPISEGNHSPTENPVPPSTEAMAQDTVPLSLEQIVQQEFDDLSVPMPMQSQDMDQAFQADPMAPMQAAINEIDHAMDQMMQMPQPEQEDPYFLMQMMYNQQMQYMANPFMMQDPFGPPMMM